MVMSATGHAARHRSILGTCAVAGPTRATVIAAGTGPGLEGIAQAKFQGHGPKHGLAAIRRADEENRVIPGSGDQQGPLRHFVAAR